jgi:hypothetical protein
MKINHEPTVAEVKAVFARYETALVTNDVVQLDRLFWDSEHTVRYGVSENLYGFQEIAAFRAQRPSIGLARFIARSVVTTFGEDFATTSIEFVRDSGMRGRQSQTWVRFDDGWRVVAAHVSVIGTQ